MARSMHPTVSITRVWDVATAEPNNIKQHKTKQNKTKQNKTKQNKTKQNKTKQNKTKQNKTKKNKTKQNKTKQNKTKQNKTKQNKTKQNKTKQNKTKQNKTKQIKTSPLKSMWWRLDPESVVRMQGQDNWKHTHALNHKLRIGGGLLKASELFSKWRVGQSVLDLLALG
jgi:hypothetical protein